MSSNIQGRELNDSRNIGLVVVRKDIENARPANGVCFVAPDLIISESDYNMDGGFFSFQGRFSPQVNLYYEVSSQISEIMESYG